MELGPRIRKKKDVTPPPKHGVHEKRHEVPSNATYPDPLDPEDPQWPPDTDPTLQPWENEDERELRSEAEDPDAPQSL